MANKLFFYPKTIEIISRRISYNHSEGLLKRITREKITLKSSSEKELNEMILEVENFKTNLKIIDNNGNEVSYLPNYMIAQINDIPEYIKNGINQKEEINRLYILVIELNQPVKKDEYYSLYLDYIEYPSKNVIKHFLYEEVLYRDLIYFYGNETLSIFNHWGDGLSIDYSILYIISTMYSDAKKRESIILLNDKKIHLSKKKNCFSFSISNKYRNKYGIDKVAIYYRIKPEKDEYRLIQTLTTFTFVLPITGFTALYFHNISYLFDSLEIESIFILTLAFAQTRTRLLSPKNYIKYIVISAGIIFILILILYVVCR